MSSSPGSMYLQLVTTFSLAVVISTFDTGSTIVEPDVVDLYKDAVVLRKAVKGWGTDEADLIDVLTHRSYNTRQAIVQQYKDTYGRNLWSDISSDTSGDFQLALKGLLLTEARFIAGELRSAVTGVGTDEDELILCLMLVVPDHSTLQAVKDEYQYIYNEELKERIVDETTSVLETFLVGIINRPKFNESAPIDGDLLDVDLADIQKYISASTPKVKEVVELLTNRSLTHLAALQEAYYQANNEEFYNRLEQISSSHLQDALVSFMSLASSYYRYVAYELYSSMDGRGTDEDALTTILVTRADRDLKQIKKVFLEMTGKELKDMVYSDTSGDYRKTLLSIIN